MIDPGSVICIEPLCADNIVPLTEMSLVLWPASRAEEEHAVWQASIGNLSQFCVLARMGDAYAGFIHMSVRSEYVEGSDADETAYLEAIFVCPEYRKQGIGSLLLHHGEAWAKSLGFRQIASDTEAGNLTGQRFHGTAGFREVNRIVCYVKDI